ncbi:hypothetical protein [Streptomyces sp. NPDC017230]
MSPGFSHASCPHASFSHASCPLVFVPLVSFLLVVPFLHGSTAV